MSDADRKLIASIPQALAETDIVCSSVNVGATKAAVNSKTTAVRIIPAPGKQVGDTVEFGGLLGSGPVQAVHTFSSRDFVARDGRIPVPMQSLKN